eukprot:scaffold4079_cov250-Pinguiococcus_pyrenoidosus.AAC.1
MIATRQAAATNVPTSVFRPMEELCPCSSAITPSFAAVAPNLARGPVLSSHEARDEVGAAGDAERQTYPAEWRSAHLRRSAECPPGGTKCSRRRRTPLHIDTDS